MNNLRECKSSEEPDSAINTLFFPTYQGFSAQRPVGTDCGHHHRFNSLKLLIWLAKFSPRTEGYAAGGLAGEGNKARKAALYQALLGGFGINVRIPGERT
jgi:hypothetical protein